MSRLARLFFQICPSNFLWTPLADITLSGIGQEQPTFTTPLGLAAGTTLSFTLVVTDQRD